MDVLSFISTFSPTEMQYNDTPNWGVYTSSKYNECLMVNNYTFYKISTEDEDSIAWRCSKRKCYATVHTNASASVLTTTNNVHAHAPRDPHYFLKLKTRQSVKRKATEYPDQRPSKMVILEVEDIREQFEDEELINFKRCIGRSRREARGGKCLPRNREEAISLLEEELISRSVKGSNLIKKVFRGDKEKNKCDIVMLATDSSLELLQCNYQVFGDGTFRYCPKFFHQLYTIHVFKDGYYVPVAYFLLNGQLFDIYRDMFNMLKPYGSLDVMT